MLQDDTSDYDGSSTANLHVDPHEAYLSGSSLGPALRGYRTARIRRAQRKARRRQMLALSVPVLAFFAALFSKGFFGSGLQSASEAAKQMVAAAKRGEFAEAAEAFYGAAKSFGESVTFKKLLIPIFLTVVLRMARAKLIRSMNGSNEQEEQAEAAAGAVTDTVAASDKNKESKDWERGALYFEWPRRLQHSIAGFIILVLYLVLPFYLALACVLVAIVFLYCVGLLRRLSPGFNGVYVQLLKGMIRSREKDPRQHPSAFPFLWGCLVVLIFCTRSLAALCVVLVSFGDPTAGICRMQCRRWAAAAASSGLNTKAENAKETTKIEGENAGAENSAFRMAESGCLCSKDNKNKINKRCLWGFMSCIVVCAVSIIVLALSLALISHPSRATSSEAGGPIVEYENPLLRHAMASSGLAYPWPSILQPTAIDSTGAAQMSVGLRLLDGDARSWAFLLGLSLAVGVVAASAEAVTFRGVDDNLTMPVICMICLASVSGAYFCLRGMAGASLGPQDLSNMSNLDLLMLLLFAL